MIKEATCLVACALWAFGCGSAQAPAVCIEGTSRLSDRVPSPDGVSSVYAAATADGEYQLFLSDAFGRHPVQITFDGLHNHSPAWSPDGRQILFVSDRDGDDEIFVMDATGRHQRQLTFNERWDGTPVWSEDGRQILFCSRHDGEITLYAITDGAGTIQLRDRQRTD